MICKECEYGKPAGWRMCWCTLYGINIREDHVCTLPGARVRTEPEETEETNGMEETEETEKGPQPGAQSCEPDAKGEFRR